MTDKFDSSYTRRDMAQRYLKAGAMFMRGWLHKYRLRESRGLLLLGKGVRIRNPQYVSSLGRLIVEDYAEIQGLSISGVSFGRDVSIGSNASIRPSGYYGRDKGEGLKIGDNSNVGSFCYIGCGGGVEIGSNVLMAPYVSIHSERHEFSDLDADMKSQGVTRSAVRIEDDCWLATGCRIMSGVTVGAGSVVAAGSVVTRDVPPQSVVAGVPAKVVRSRSDEKQ